MPNCNQCGLQFSRNFCLKRHERSHYGKEQYVCVDCHKVYARFDNLQKHRSRSKGRCRKALRHQSVPHATQGGNDLDNTKSFALSTARTPVAPPFQGQSSQITARSDYDRQRETLQIVPTTTSQNSQMPLASASIAMPGSFTTSPWAVASMPEVPIHSVDTGQTQETSSESSDGEPDGYKPDGQLDASMSMDSQPSLPSFAIDIIQRLRRRFPNAGLSGVMRNNFAGSLDRCSSSHLLETLGNGRKQFKPHWVPVVQCLDCLGQECFEVSPFQENHAIKEHLRRHDHRLIRSNRKREAWLAAHDGFPWPSIHELERNFAALDDQKLLILAVRTQNINVLRKLLEDGCRVQEKDKSHQSALHWACKLGHRDMAELLVRYGAALDDYDDKVQTPLDLALEVSVDFAVGLVRVLAEVKRNESEFATETPLVYACRFNRLSVVEGLVETGADVNETTINFPLAIAVRHASWEVVRYLLSKGACLQVIDMFHLQHLAKKRAGTYIGSDYQDAAEKIKLLKRHGIKFGRKTRARLAPWYY